LGWSLGVIGPCLQEGDPVCHPFLFGSERFAKQAKCSQVTLGMIEPVDLGLEKTFDLFQASLQGLVLLVQPFQVAWVQGIHLMMVGLVFRTLRIAC